MAIRRNARGWFAWDQAFDRQNVRFDDEYTFSSVPNHKQHCKECVSLESHVLRCFRRQGGIIMDIQNQFGARVRELRARAGVTQAELAQRCGDGVEMQRIGEIERGEQNCTIKTVQRLAKGLRCEPAELFLFSPTRHVGRAMSLLDARLVDLWQAADDPTKQKAIRILSELV